MKNLGWGLVLGCFFFCGCGDDDAAPDAGLSDAATDATIDAPVDAGPDAAPADASLPVDPALADTTQALCVYDNGGWLEDEGCAETYTEGSSTHPTGQDGHYVDIPRARSFEEPAADPSYADDYVTVDNVTGLVWKTCVEGKTGETCLGAPSNLTHAEAIDACLALNALNGGDGFAGRTDWRLATIFDILNIKTFDLTSPSVDPTLFPNTPGLSYWTSTDAWEDSSSAYRVTFGTGGAYATGKTNPNMARCVSGNWSGSNGFTYTNLGDNTVLQNETGLVWERCVEGTGGDDCETGEPDGMDATAALAHCEEMNKASETDWRLPNAVELHSIADYGQAAAPLDAAFPTPFPAGYWSSTAGGSSGAGGVFSFSVISATLGSTARDGDNKVRCVRGPDLD